MSFFEDLAAALDAEGIESRVGGDVLFVPITADVEIQFVEVDPQLPAASVFIAAADVDEDDEDFSAALVAVVFSVDDAVRTVAAHVAIDQTITVLRDLLEATDERIGDLEFIQDLRDPNLVCADVGDSSQLRVVVEPVDDVPQATVSFVAIPEVDDDLIDEAISQAWFGGTAAGTSAPRISADLRDELYDAIGEDAAAFGQEVLSLGTYTDFDKLFDVLSFAADQAEDWEEQLDPVGLDADEDHEIVELLVDYLGDERPVGRRPVAVESGLFSGGFAGFDEEYYYFDDDDDDGDEDDDDDFDDEDGDRVAGAGGDDDAAGRGRGMNNEGAEG